MSLQGKLLDHLQKAKTHKEKAEGLCVQANKHRTRKALRPAINKLRQFMRTLRTRKAKAVPPALKDELIGAADALVRDMATLQRTLQCPPS